MKMYKYPSIDQFRNLVKTIVLSNSYEGRDENGNPIYNPLAIPPIVTINGTVKLHGSNSSIVYDSEDNYYAQSRERVLSIESDNAGFCVFSHRVKSFVEPILKNILSDYESALSVVIYGEWCGKGIQKSIGVSELDKMLVLFGIKVTYPDETEGHRGEWIDNDLLSRFVNEDLRIFNIYDFKTYSLEVDLSNAAMVQNKLIELTEQVEKECPVAKHFGIENGCGEGIVWTANFKGNTYRMKTKGEKHSVTKVKTLSAVDIEKLESVDKFVEYAVTENRLDQGISYFKENNIQLEIKNIGQFISWVTKDVIKEEIDTMSENNITSKEFGSRASIKSRNFFINYINSNI